MYDIFQVPPGFLTTTELAFELGLSERAVYKWVSVGRLPRPIKDGRRSLFNKQAVAPHLSKHPIARFVQSA